MSEENFNGLDSPFPVFDCSFDYKSVVKAGKKLEEILREHEDLE